MQFKNILATAKQYGSAAALVQPIKLLRERGHKVTVYATGSATEAMGFRQNYQEIHPEEQDYFSLIRGYELILVGLSGYETADGHFIRAATEQKIPSVGVNDQNYNYKLRFGGEEKNLPTRIALMNEECKQRIKEELPPELAAEVLKRSKVVGWTNYDNYAIIRESFSPQQRHNLMADLGLNPQAPLHLYFSNNIHPEAEYWGPYREWPAEKRKKYYDYEMQLTEAVLKAARELGLRLAVKPHPGENTDDTERLVKGYQFTFLSASSCDTTQLMLAATSITVGKSGCLNEGCLFDKNTGGVFPGIDQKELIPYPPFTAQAIPYTLTWEGIFEVIKTITSENPITNEELAQQRKRFSVDGKASKRLVELIEGL